MHAGRLRPDASHWRSVSIVHRVETTKGPARTGRPFLLPHAWPIPHRSALMLLAMRPDDGWQSSVRAQYAAVIFHTVSVNFLRRRLPDASITRIVGYQVRGLVATPVITPEAWSIERPVGRLPRTTAI